MSTGWRKSGTTVLSSLRDLVLVVLAFGGVQLLLSVGVWAALFRSYPQGFSMALTLVGFGGWFIAFTSSFTGRRRVPWGQDPQLPVGDRAPTEPDDPARGASPPATPLVGAAQTHIRRFGCGTVMFLSSLIPLVLAFILRVQADMQTGKTWSDIFPAVP